jgi:flavin-dependent dehydrogenase
MCLTDINKELLREYIAKTTMMHEYLKDAKFDTDVRKMDGYSCDVTSLYGNKFALLGNAGEFLDPVFSSGVTIALKSADLATKVLDKQLKGINVDWEIEYAQPLKQGVSTFKVFVEGWYNGTLQDVIFAEDKSIQIKEMISSVLAGYAWDTKNPYVKDPSRLKVLAELCRS